MTFCTGCNNLEDGRFVSEWKPNLSEPWNFDPVFPFNDECEYDSEFTIEQSTYSEAPEYFVCTAVNKTGKTFRVGARIAVEKLYNGIYYSSFGEMESAWVRIPYGGASVVGVSARADVTWRQEVSKYLQKDFDFTPGQYRLVMFAGDGPHYAYFEITG